MSRDQIFVVLALFAIFNTGSARTGYGHGDQEWGFVDIREGAHMFYWLYKTTANVSHYTERPFALWLQGGPGESSTGIGNFHELGPLDIDGQNRSLNWVKDMNVLFIDNPVGSGFSYVDNKKYLATNNEAIALDLLKFMKSFYSKHPEFVNVPLHIFGESYGGKMAADFALQLYNAIQRNVIKCNLTSVTLADPMISTIDTMLAWAPYLLAMGVVDQDGYNHVQSSVEKTMELMQEGDWYEAAKEYINTTAIITKETHGVDFFNILDPQDAIELAGGEANLANLLLKLILIVRDLYEVAKKYINTAAHGVDFFNILDPQDASGLLQRRLILYNDESEKLQTLMRGPVSTALGIPFHVVWGSQRLNTFISLMTDMLKPVNQTVHHLLSNTNLTVNVITGQLDLLCPTIGTVNWIDNLQWKHSNEYFNAPRIDININDIVEGYEKSFGKFSFYWVLRAGHMATADNPTAVSHIVKKIAKYT